MKLLICIVVLPHLLSSVTHWVLQDNVIYTKERSEYDLLEYSSLYKVLRQDALVQDADNVLDKLEMVKQDIMNDAPLLKSDNVGEKDCLESGLLSDFDFSILPAIEKTVDGYSKFEQYMCTTNIPTNIPNCTTGSKPTFSMGDYRHIPGVKYVTEERSSPSYNLLSFIPTDDVALFGHCLHHYMRQNSTNWHVYFGASFYWRLQGNDVAALQCTFKSLHYTNNRRDLVDGPLVTLSNLLSSASFDSDAALVMEHSAMTPYLQQLKLWSAGNLYTVSEQYKLSLEMYNRTLELGPFPLADKRVKTMECYSNVINRMETQNNLLRSTLLKLQERHELETQYIGIQENMFSNLNNFTLPEHIIQQIRNTEDAVRNTHKLVLEQREIQNTLSSTTFTFPVTLDGDIAEAMFDELDTLLEDFPEQEPELKTVHRTTKKDISWMHSTRLKLEKLISHIKIQLSDNDNVPITYFYEDDFEDEPLHSHDDEPLHSHDDEPLHSHDDEPLHSHDDEPLHSHDDDLDDDMITVTAEVIPPDQDNIEVKADSLTPNLTLKQKVDKIGERIVVVPVTCEIPRDKPRDKTDDAAPENRVRILIKEETDTSVIFELFSEEEKENWVNLKSSKSMIEKQLSGIFSGKHVIVRVDEGAGTSGGVTNIAQLIAHNLKSKDLIESLKLVRVNMKPPPPREMTDKEVLINLSQDLEYTLRLRQIDSANTPTVKLETCESYVPIFTHNEPYFPLMIPLISHGILVHKIFQNLPKNIQPASPDCMGHMDLEHCDICYDGLFGVRTSLQNERLVNEPFATHELEHTLKDMDLLGAILDYRLKEDPNNWVLYHMAALYHRATAQHIGPAVQCTRRALALVPHRHRTIPLLTLANILHQASNYPDAMTVVLEMMVMGPKQPLNYIESAMLHIAIGEPHGAFYAALEALRVQPTSAVNQQLLNSLLCYYDINKEKGQAPFKKFIHYKAISNLKKRPPYTKVNKKPLDGEVWEISHHDGGKVNVMWVKDP